VNKTCSRCGAIGPAEDMRPCRECGKLTVCRICYALPHRYHEPNCASCQPEEARRVQAELAATGPCDAIRDFRHLVGGRA
jgi:hypothetical protein